ncbi:alpha-1,2-mannosyltransferase ALG9 [Condylostylus longicornis]|uniref:alpha-1,2-mannosyltransferase ALG9 n=1 Tax=Condylostylus longicornis TaxID=2530218 RepID=UPI00244E59A7|nr:alpha-1,2-mannosyltransferase ALG9 [Condylostylus longicornis]
MVRHRFSDSNHQIVSKKTLKKLNKETNLARNKNISNGQSSSQKTHSAVPGIDTAFKVFLSARFCSAIWAYISDCDETFNYWEPLHYIIYGHGLQTWEYSPQFALRSYTYLMLQGVPGWIYNKIFEPSPLLIFYFTRCMLALVCAVIERYFYKAVAREFGIHIARLWLIFQLFSVGMFISSTALLPSSFSMYFGTAALAAWWLQNYNLAIFFIAISALLGWPFAALVGLPLAYDMSVRARKWRSFLIWAAISAVTILLPMIAIDTSFFGKITVAPLNIILYNVFTEHGPNLYGTEPYSYYLINGFLNFNIIWLFALVAPVMLIFEYLLVPAKSRSTLNYPAYLTLSPFYLWLLVFIIQPHKEERFLFPIYPMISLCGAITVDIFQKLIFRIRCLFRQFKNGVHYLDDTMVFAIAVMLVSAGIGMSRILALYRNYHAPMNLLLELNEFKNSPQFREDNTYNVCIGKDWYRYPTSFLLPSKHFRIRFLKSEFKGILPAYYSNGDNATAIIHPYFNDMNQEDERMYFDYDKCNFLIDLDIGKYTMLEPNYSARKEWSIMKAIPFLNTENSNKILRAFYIPFLSEKYITYGSFNLLKRKKFKSPQGKKEEA